MRQKLLSLGVSAHGRLIRQLVHSRSDARASGSRAPSVRAPLEVLQHTLTQWNKLLELCEKKTMDSFGAQGAAMGADLLADLSRYRKVMPQPAVESASVNEVK